MCFCATESHQQKIIFTWLRSVVGERGRGAEGGEKRLANRSRRATPAAEPQTEALRYCVEHERMPSVTSARICGVKRASSKGTGRRAARETKQTARWSRRVCDLIFLALLHKLDGIKCGEFGRVF